MEVAECMGYHPLTFLVISIYVHTIVCMCCGLFTMFVRDSVTSWLNLHRQLQSKATLWRTAGLVSTGDGQVVKWVKAGHSA